MFDPTIFENMKVALESAVYDQDFAGEIAVISRSDRVELSSMSREYSIGYVDRKRGKGPEITALLTLSAGAEDLAGEILEIKETAQRRFGCVLHVTLLLDIDNVERCRDIEEIVGSVWLYRPRIVQELSFTYSTGREGEHQGYRNTITLHFDRKINEDNIDDLFGIIEYTLHSLRALAAAE
ncbi:hypothetical protein JQN58_13290 [Aneurinibacillus sp. BA2021]|nr:hypothetical protein [Aneurinibacillus sp. BA2021]